MTVKYPSPGPEPSRSPSHTNLSGGTPFGGLTANGFYLATVISKPSFRARAGIHLGAYRGLEDGFRIPSTKP